MICMSPVDLPAVISSTCALGSVSLCVLPDSFLATPLSPLKSLTDSFFHVASDYIYIYIMQILIALEQLSEAEQKRLFKSI